MNNTFTYSCEVQEDNDWEHTFESDLESWLWYLTN